MLSKESLQEATAQGVVVSSKTPVVEEDALSVWEGEGGFVWTPVDAKVK